MKFSKFFTAIFSYAGLLGPSLLTLHILNLTLISDISIPPMDVSRQEIQEETIKPDSPGIIFDFPVEQKEEEEEEDIVDEEEEGEEDGAEEEEPIEEEQQDPEPEEEKKEEEPENSKEEEEGPKLINEDGKLDYDKVAAWAKEAMELYDRETGGN